MRNMYNIAMDLEEGADNLCIDLPPHLGNGVDRYRDPPPPPLMFARIASSANELYFQTVLRIRISNYFSSLSLILVLILPLKIKILSKI